MQTVPSPHYHPPTIRSDRKRSGNRAGDATLTPEELPDGWAFPRRVQTPAGEVLVEDHYRRRPGQAAAYGGKVVYDFVRAGPMDRG